MASARVFLALALAAIFLIASTEATRSLLDAWANCRERGECWHALWCCLAARCLLLEVDYIMAAAANLAPAVTAAK